MEQKVASSNPNAKKPQAAGAKKVKAIASKRYMNFARHESSLNMKKLGIVFLILVIVGGLFAKFAIIDQLAKKTKAYDDLAVVQSELSVQNARMAKYNELKEEYDTYSFGRMDDEEVSTVARTDILDIVESVIMTDAKVSEIKVDGNVVEVAIRNIDMEQGSQLITALNEQELVSYAYPISAVDEEEENVFTVGILVRKVVE